MGATFGASSVTMIRSGDSPCSRALVTYFLPISASTAARTMRAMPGAKTTPMMMISAGTRRRTRPRHDQEDERRQHDEHVEHAHERGVDPAAEVGGDDAERAAEDGGEDGADRADRQRGVRPGQGPGEHAAPQFVGAERLRPARRGQRLPAVAVRVEAEQAPGRAPPPPTSTTIRALITNVGRRSSARTRRRPAPRPLVRAAPGPATRPVITSARPRPPAGRAAPSRAPTGRDRFRLPLGKESISSPCSRIGCADPSGSGTRRSGAGRAARSRR